MAAIETDGLTKDYGEVLAVDFLTLSVDRGEVFGYLGPNGAGKTTTIRMLLGFIKPTAGSVSVLGHPILVANLVTPVVVLVSAWLIDDPLSAVDVAAVHLLSTPYLFACAGIGILCSVMFDRAGIAQQIALAGTFALFLVESLLEGADYERLGAISPMRYYDPNGILLDGNYDLLGAAVLLGMTILLVLCSHLGFTRKDI